ncbi:hypothetical protein AB205_0091140 [Aquarana catesbeiana]|uniref:Uncharacterized protein n=1 Tax=Aquarana catesbeiana TaxID=8400 RepID=A0A2G9QDR0_AQUCT|nr:hypothetical protein AB205_0091140 [Aquarana catesbeiana]
MFDSNMSSTRTRSSSLMVTSSRGSKVVMVIGHTECMESLVNSGVSIQHYIKHLGSPLYVACENQKVDTAKRLLELGASANIGKDLDTPLHAASRNGNADLMNLIIDYGGSTQSRNTDGKRPSELIPPHSSLNEIFLKREGRH